MAETSQFSRMLRLTLALGVGLLILLLLLALLFLSETLFDVWERLQQAPDWFFYLYFSGILAVVLVGGLVVWRLLRPRRRRRKKVGEGSEGAEAPDREEIERRLEEATEQGLDVESVRRELAKLRERKAAARIFVSFFGEISCGKSSLVQALLPDARLEVSARGGTTREINEYHWRSPSGDELVLTDMPGTNEVGVGLDQLAQDEAQRSHVVVYVCDGDLGRSQYEELQALLELGKPCILALNKSDRYRQDELDQLRERLEERLAGYAGTELVSVQAGGQREAVRVLPDGREERVMRQMPPRVEALQRALQRYLDEDPKVLDELRDSAVFVLVAKQLDAAQAARRREKAGELVSSYTKKAIVGALAAVTPGTDLLIQGYLGIELIKALSTLYDAPARKVDVDLLLELVQKHVGKTTTLTLAVAGNALKAFPGVGTLAGGMVHAVAYGLIFSSLGRAVAQSLETRGTLRPAQAARAFEENLSEDLEASAGRFARLALALRKEVRGER